MRMLNRLEGVEAHGEQRAVHLQFTDDRHVCVFIRSFPLTSRRDLEFSLLQFQPAPRLNLLSMILIPNSRHLLPALQAGAAPG